MGMGRWDDVKTRSLYANSAATRTTQTREEIFTSNHINEALDPSKIVLRESRDSEFNPNSTAIIVALDVTGSMGIIAEKLAREKLGKLMEGIFEKQPIVDPQVMVMAIGDVFCDQAPLQVSQFEADIKIDESLQNLYLEGNGGGNQFESYDLPWFFAGAKTSIDCFEKRGKKGYLFTIGDEFPPMNEMTERELKKVFGKTQDIPMSRTEALTSAQEKYDVFHVIVEQGNFARGRTSQVVGKWREILDKRAIPLNDWENIAEVIVAAMELNEGKDLEDVLSEQTSESVISSIKHAFQ